MSANARRTRERATGNAEAALQSGGQVLHRVVPIPLSLDEERDGAKQWRCAHCDKRFRFPDEAEDSECSARPLFGENS